MFCVFAFFKAVVRDFYLLMAHNLKVNEKQEIYQFFLIHCVIKNVK